MRILNNIVKEVHETAKSKGWWEKPRSLGEVCMLIVSEVAEATEEVRNNTPKVYQMQNANGAANDYLVPHGHDFWDAKFKPEGEPIELMDAQIRLMDYFGFMNWDLSEMLNRESVINSTSEFLTFIQDATPLEIHLRIVRAVSLATANVALENEKIRQNCLANAFNYIDLTFLYNDWKWEEIYKLKSDYNKTRSYRHGGKAL